MKINPFNLFSADKDKKTKKGVKVVNDSSIDTTDKFTPRGCGYVGGGGYHKPTHGGCGSYSKPTHGGCGYVGCGGYHKPRYRGC